MVKNLSRLLLRSQRLFQEKRKKKLLDKRKVSLSGKNTKSTAGRNKNLFFKPLLKKCI